MNPLILLTKKNLKLLIRSKSSALVVIFAPLLIILILGLSYSTSSQFGLNIGVYSDSFTEDVNTFMSTLQEQEFKIVKYEVSIDECIEDIKLGFIHACISVPESFKITENKPKEVTFYLDPSKINLVYMIQETLASKFNLKSQQISQELTQDILNKITQAKIDIDKRIEELNSIKGKSTSASSSTETIRANLAGINLTATTSTYNTATLTELKENISAGIQTSISKINDAAAAIDDVNLTSAEKTPIKNTLSETNTTLTNTLDTLSGNETVSFDSISSLISSLEDDLETNKAKLSAASEKISASTLGLNSATDTIKQSITAIESVESGLGTIKANLEAQKITEETISAPLITKIEKIGQPVSFLSYIFPALLVIVIMFSSLLLGTSLVMMEKNSPAFFRNYFLPLKKGTFIISIYLTNMVITMIQILIILGISLFFLKDNLSVIFLIGLVLIVSSSVFSFLGMGMGYLFKSEETGILASISLGSFLLLISGVILPLESVSTAVRKITYFNPFVISEKIIRELLFFNSSFEAIWLDLLTLIGFAVVFFLLILIAEILVNKHVFNHPNKNKKQVPTAVKRKE
ncbi:MAG: ABC transporter permease [Nanoarchaeota archaeon]|nr:ABC transporter permease [Nanoarchaeota archaeon]MBU1632862.1 ABC transporter permease [Nanoarchaeota archaeon]MBU1876668.1 ABC transporter permease [Nanoarchaeota archaeon]